MAASDEALVAQCLDGNKDAFAELVSRYQTLVCSVAYAVTGNFARSEDVGQDAFVAAWKDLGTLKDAPRFKSWLCSITRNLARNAMRGEGKHEFRAFDEPVPDMRSSPDDEAAQREEQALVWSALSQMPADYREPLVLFYRQDQSIADVSRTLDLSADVVKQRLSRGRKMLRAEVISVVERTLKQTTPTRAFTIAVLAAIPAMTSKTAAAAGAGSAGMLANAAIGSGAAKAGGILGSAMGSVVGLGGAALGTWASWTTAQYQSQRDLIRRQTIIYIVGMSIFLLPFVAMMLGWRPHRLLGAGGYLIAYGIWMTVFMTANFVWMFRMMQTWKSITSREQAAGTVELPVTPARRWITKWEGRRWRSSAKVFGWPVVDIAFSDPSGDLAAEDRRAQGRARGWIAIGDNARGLLLAVGNVAVAPVAAGTLSAGIISFGVLSIGVFSFGVFAVAVAAIGVLTFGVWSIGCAVAIGYVAAGPVAIGWEAAQGAVAIAFKYADGAKAIAEHPGDDAAKAFFANSSFFQFAGRAMQLVIAASRSPHRFWAIIAVPALFLAIVRAAYHRRIVQ